MKETHRSIDRWIDSVGVVFECGFGGLREAWGVDWYREASTETKFGKEKIWSVEYEGEFECGKKYRISYQNSGDGKKRGKRSGGRA
jgi:hypothetical protein